MSIPAAAGLGHVAIDIESINPYNSEGMFAIAITHSADPKDAVVIYLPPCCQGNPSTIEWWSKDPARKAFLGLGLARATLNTRRDAAAQLRAEIDDLYAKYPAGLVFHADCALFDLGQCDALLAQHGFLPTYMRKAGEAPGEFTDYTVVAKAKAGLDIAEGKTDDAFAKLGLQREPRADNHDPVVDIVGIWKEAVAVWGAKAVV